VLRLPVLSLPLLVWDGIPLVLVLVLDAEVECDAAVVVDAELDDVCCGTHSTGDHEARATALKVSVGGEPSQALLPQHSQVCVFWFHWIQVWESSAVSEGRTGVSQKAFLFELQSSFSDRISGKKIERKRKHPLQEVRQTGSP